MQEFKNTITRLRVACNKVCLKICLVVVALYLHTLSIGLQWLLIVDTDLHHGSKAGQRGSWIGNHWFANLRSGQSCNDHQDRPPDLNTIVVPLICTLTRASALDVTHIFHAAAVLRHGDFCTLQE